MRIAFLFLLLVASLWVEWRLLQDRNLPYLRWVVLVLGGGVAQIGAALFAIGQGYSLSRRPQTDVSQWRDGERIRVGGVVRATDGVLRTPFTQRDAVAMELALRAADVAPGETQTLLDRRTRFAPEFQGSDQVPFGIMTSRGFVAVVGVPDLRRFSGWASMDPANCNPAGVMMASVRWRLAGLRSREGVYRELVGHEDPAMRFYLLNHWAVELAFRPPGEPPAGWLENADPPQLEGEAAAAAIAQRLRKRFWKFSEHALAVGESVTVEGIYRSNPPRIEIGHWVRDYRAKDAIRPGLAGQSAKLHLREKRTAAARSDCS